MMRKCVECGESQEGNFYRSNRTRCKACLCRRTTLIYAPRRREKQAEYYKEWYARNGRRRSPNYTDVIVLWQRNHSGAVRTQGKLHYAVKKGLLMRPENCVLCGKGGRMGGHHEDYNFPFEVMWVCSSCHKKIHLRLVGVK